MSEGAGVLGLEAGAGSRVSSPESLHLRVSGSSDAEGGGGGEEEEELEESEDDEDEEEVPPSLPKQRVSRRKKNECTAEGAPSTEILSEANLVRVETAGQQLVDLVGEAKLGTYRFCSVIKFATGVLNENDEETFLNWYCELNENGNLKHFPSNVVGKLRAAYFDQCKKAKISKVQQNKA